MTINTAAAALSYAGDDATVAFAITWKYFAKSHVVAILRDSAGAETTWVLDTDYALTAAGVDAGGTLTATTAPATNETLVITLEPPNTQLTDIPLGGSFPASSVEDALDQAAQRDSKIQEELDRTLRVPKTDTRSGSQLEIPNETNRASAFLAFDANGDPIASTGPTGDSSIPVSTYIETLLDDVDAGTARTTLGAVGLTGNETIAGNKTLSGDTVFTGDVRYSDDGELTIATGAITVTGANHTVDTESDASTDNLDTINGGNDGQLLYLSAENNARDVVITNAGNVVTAGAQHVLMASTSECIPLIYSAALAKWQVLAMPAKPAFGVLPASVQTNLTASTNNTIVFGTEVFDVGGNFASNTFTAPVTGKYYLSSKIDLSGLDITGTALTMSIVTSNKTFITTFEPDEVYAGGSAPTAETMAFSILAEMDASDTAHITVNPAAISSIDVQVTSYFSGYLAT